MTARQVAAALRPYAETIRETYRARVSVAYDDSGDGAAVYGMPADPARSSFGYTGEHVKGARRILNARFGGSANDRAAAFTLDAAETALVDALLLVDGELPDTPGGSANRVARFRAACAQGGFCITCGRYPAREERKTCEHCAASAAERVKRARERRRAQGVTKRKKQPARGKRARSVVNG